jgi:hypothetical protein
MDGANQLFKVNAKGKARVIYPRQVLTENLNIQIKRSGQAIFGGDTETVVDSLACVTCR